MKNAAAVALGGILALSRLSLAAGPTREVTFTKDIAPILQAEVPGVPSRRIHGADVSGDL